MGSLRDFDTAVDGGCTRERLVADTGVVALRSARGGGTLSGVASSGHAAEAAPAFSFGIGCFHFPDTLAASDGVVMLTPRTRSCCSTVSTARHVHSRRLICRLARTSLRRPVCSSGMG